MIRAEGVKEKYASSKRDQRSILPRDEVEFVREKLKSRSTALSLEIAGELSSLINFSKISVTLSRLYISFKAKAFR